MIKLAAFHDELNKMMEQEEKTPQQTEQKAVVSKGRVVIDPETGEKFLMTQGIPYDDGKQVDLGQTQPQQPTQEVTSQPTGPGSNEQVGPPKDPSKVASVKEYIPHALSGTALATSALALHKARKAGKKTDDLSKMDVENVNSIARDIVNLSEQNKTLLRNQIALNEAMKSK